MSFSEHVYCVAITFKLSKKSNESASNSTLSWNIPPWKLSQKAAAMDNWCITTTHPLMHRISCRVFSAKYQITQGTQDPLQPKFGVLKLLAFPKTKITNEREETSDCGWDSGKYDRAADGDWENCVRSQGAYFEGDWDIIVLYAMFLVSSSINISIFHISWTFSGQKITTSVRYECIIWRNWCVTFQMKYLLSKYF